MYCGNCGHPHDVGVAFCGQCGAAVQSAPERVALTAQNVAPHPQAPGGSPPGPPRGGRSRGRGGLVAGAVVITLAAAGGGGVWWWLAERGQDPRASDASEHRARVAPAAPTRDPGPSTSAPPNSPPPPLAEPRCFDGSPAEGPGSCLARMRHPERPWPAIHAALPGLPRACVADDDPPDRKLAAWTCTRDDVRVTASLYPDVASARQHYDEKRDGVRTTDGNHYTWTYRTLDEAGNTVVSGLYLAVPISVTVNGADPDAVKKAYRGLGWVPDARLGLVDQPG